MEEQQHYFNRDLSWLSFNYRVLQEAKDKEVPLYERIKFLAIYSSNLDEFFRVRVASIMSLASIDKKKLNKELELKPKKLLQQIHHTVQIQLNEFGEILHDHILPELRENNINLHYGTKIPSEHHAEIQHFFKSKVLAYLQPVFLKPGKKRPYFLNNRGIYFVLKLKNLKKDKIEYAHLNIPSEYLPRFMIFKSADESHEIVFLDDIIKLNLKFVFPNHRVLGCYSIKLNKDADLNIEDEYSGDLVEKIRKQLDKRNIGEASRFLFDNKMPEEFLDYLMEVYQLDEEELVPGGRYHNLNDFFKLPNPHKPKFQNEQQKPVVKKSLDRESSIFAAIRKKDQMLHFPYHSYDYVLRFFNEAAIDPNVEEIKITLYRIAAESLIARALISAAKNDKKVTVFVEVKARFDEENNLRWAKKMEEAGINIIYSIPGLKVHAKVALVKRKNDADEISGYAFFGTGNFNESTASIYVDHGLLTTHPEMIQELDMVFKYLHKRKPVKEFNHLLVSQFNLQERFLEKMDREIANAKAGNRAEITIKLNNLEDEVMIDKLYEANCAGVKVTLINRGICCLVPGIEGLSENIKVIRLVDMFLEHARIFMFYNGGEEEIYLSSADWMKRNLYRRIEVGFPVYDPKIKRELKKFIQLQIQDNCKLKSINQQHENVEVIRRKNQPSRRAQRDAYHWIKAMEQGR
ncbi:polyphosphate kinase 1 [Fulvivirgaceae bacterium BMA10]|uniref:Polyphosphate kinase n=1 Tax=Splendidivirga corallicola TaxID=3051826 RepID=A0ABT8KST3_9BACT|nr:polyphosphate kinase 1 [Fulvivirgaceae bacterium BMA10]